MNSWLSIRRVRGPAFLILIGVNALLNQWGVLSFGRSWPLYLILAGIFGLAERAALAAAPPVYPAPWSGYTPPSAYPAATALQTSAPSTQTAGSQDPYIDPERRV